MRTVKVHATSDYNVIIGENILDSTGLYVSGAIDSARRVCIVTDDTVNTLYGERVQRSLVNSGYGVIKFIIEHGEGSKNPEKLIALLNYMAEAKLTRTDIVLALGGGVVGDLAGFAAAVYLRGIRFVQVPTTLLAAVDSSVGGKTAVDLAAGKNLIGAFHQPSLVLCDTKTLDTLPEDIFSDGCAEVIKYGIINDKRFFDRLKGGIKNDIENVIAECVQKKSDIVSEDEFDNGKRQLLNLGHTVGHAIEICSGLSVSHGSAVAIGTVIVTKIAISLGICPKDQLDELVALLTANRLPTNCIYSASELAKIAASDKKRSGDSISLILPYGIGNCKPLSVPIDELCALIERGLSA